MFTGIVTHIGEVYSVKSEGSGKVIEVFAPFDEPIKIELKADEDGSILDIIVDGESKGTSYQALANLIALGEPASTSKIRQ